MSPLSTALPPTLGFPCVVGLSLIKHVLNSSTPQLDSIQARRVCVKAAQQLLYVKTAGHEDVGDPYPARSKTHI